MAGDILTTEDTINGLEGKVLLKQGGRSLVVAEVTEITATYTIETAQQKVIGRRNALNKEVGGTGAGTMTILYGTEIFDDMVLQYQKTGKLPSFDLLCENNDKASNRGAMRKMLYGCKISGSFDVFKMNTSDAYLNKSISFTYDTWDKV